MSFFKLSLAQAHLWTLLFCIWVGVANTSSVQLTGVQIKRGRDQDPSTSAYLLLGPFAAASTSQAGTSFSLQTSATSHYGSTDFTQKCFMKVQSQATSGAIPTTWECEVFSQLTTSGDTVTTSVCCCLSRHYPHVSHSVGASCSHLFLHACSCCTPCSV